MENPATWTKAEHVVNQALIEADRRISVGIYGLSKARQVTDALKAAGICLEQHEE